MKFSGWLIALGCAFGIAPAFAADRDLGQNLAYRTSPTGSPAFGSVYTYGDDPDGTSYLFNFSPDVDNTTAVKTFRWNFYLKSTDQFLLDWSDQRKVPAAVIQVRVGDEPILKQMLIGQKKVDGRGELYFVLAGDDNVPLFNVSISDLCASVPKNFKDLTNGQPCDQLKP